MYTNSRRIGLQCPPRRLQMKLSINRLSGVSCQIVLTIHHASSSLLYQTQFLVLYKNVEWINVSKNTCLGARSAA